MDPELLEELGMKPTGSPDAREIREQYLDRLARKVKGDRDVARVKVRMKERHMIEGQGTFVPKGREWMIPEGAFHSLNKRLGGKLELVDKHTAIIQERDEAPRRKVMMPQDSVTKG